MRGLLLIICVLLLSGCAALEREWVAENCNYDAGIGRGLKDAMRAKPFSLEDFDVCPGSHRGRAEAGYRKGYEQAVLQDQAVIGMAAARRQNTGHHKPNEQNYQCFVDTHTERFSSYGETRQIASKNVKEKCSQKLKAIHCSRISCRINR